jgi:hypothetical protein
MGEKQQHPNVKKTYFNKAMMSKKQRERVEEKRRN